MARLFLPSAARSFALNAACSSITCHCQSKLFAALVLWPSLPSLRLSCLPLWPWLLLLLGFQVVKYCRARAALRRLLCGISAALPIPSSPAIHARTALRLSRLANWLSTHKWSSPLIPHTITGLLACYSWTAVHPSLCQPNTNQSTAHGTHPCTALQLLSTALHNTQNVTQTYTNVNRHANIHQTIYTTH